VVGGLKVRSADGKVIPGLDIGCCVADSSQLAFI
jgi:hypothetical protein